jgi:hypothetical protein
MDDSDLSVLEDGSPTKHKASKLKGKGKEKACQSMDRPLVECVTTV